MEPLMMNGFPHYRTIVALDIERSTSRPDPVKAELRNKIYELFDAALSAAGIRQRHRDRYIDRGDGLLALIHPVGQAPKVLLLNRVIPALSDLLTDYNTSLPHSQRPQRELRIRAVMHAGDVHYDANGCFGEALDVAFRMLDADPVKKALGESADSLALVISEDIYSSVVRHGYHGIDQDAFHRRVRVQIAGKRYPGWIHIPGQTRSTVALFLRAEDRNCRRSKRAKSEPGDGTKRTNAAAGNVRPASSRRRPRARPRRWSVAVAGVRWSGPGGGSIAVLLVARSCWWRGGGWGW